MCNVDRLNTEWKIMCASQKVCPSVRVRLQKEGFRLLKETPNSLDSDLVMEIDIERDQITEKGDKIFEICRGKVQQISIRET